MTTKLQPTLFALAIAMLFIAASALFAEPLPADRAKPERALTAEAKNTDSGSEDSAAVEQLVRLKTRVELSMPYYSFGSMLPRGRGS
jgi:hypothetical protein